MANGYTSFNNGTVLVIQWYGDVHYEDCLAFNKRLVSDTSIQTGAVMLTDSRFATFDNTPEQAIELWHLWEETNQGKGIIKHALMVSDEQFPKAKAFEKAVMSKGMTTIVFSNFSVACKWLGVEYEQIVHCLDEMELT